MSEAIEFGRWVATGRTRVRAGRFGKLILQVEVVWSRQEATHPHSVMTSYQWRDADVSDLTIGTFPTSPTKPREARQVNPPEKSALAIPAVNRGNS